MQIDDHHDTGLDGHPIERDVSDPDCDREVVAEQPLQDDAARHRVDNRQHHDRCLRRRVERHVQQHEDDEEHERDEDSEPLPGTDLELVLPRPQKRVSRRQLQSLRNRILGPVDVPTGIACCRIHVDVPGELSVLIADHRRTG